MIFNFRNYYNQVPQAYFPANYTMERVCVIFTPKQDRNILYAIGQLVSSNQLLYLTNQSEAFTGLVLQSTVCAMFTSCQVAIFARLVSSSKTTKKIQKISLNFLFIGLYY